MRFVAKALRGLYVWHPRHGLYYCPADGTPGYPVAYIAIEARSLRERAAELRAGQRLDRHRLARRLERAALALEALADAPVPA
ncbi:MAG: hypothetical protein JNM56_32880 [Planctomycetia bacterium]|nr:hypothetical protein [Planctomycetia bacterium]